MVYKAHPIQALYCSLNSAAFRAVETDKIPALLEARGGRVQVHGERVQLSSLAQKWRVAVRKDAERHAAGARNPNCYNTIINPWRPLL